MCSSISLSRCEQMRTVSAEHPLRVFIRGCTNLDSSYESGTWIKHDDVFRSDFLEDSIVFVTEVRTNDDQVLLSDQSEVFFESKRIECFFLQFRGF